MHHQPLRKHALVANCQAATYPNKPTRIITGFALGGNAGITARILDSKSEYELWGKLINTFNYTAQ